MEKGFQDGAYMRSLPRTLSALAVGRSLGLRSSVKAPLVARGDVSRCYQISASVRLRKEGQGYFSGPRPWGVRLSTSLLRFWRVHFAFIIKTFDWEHI